MKVLRLIALLLAWPLALASQGFSEGPDFPPYPVPDHVKLKSGPTLPAKLDLSKSTYFPSVIDQYGWSCNQAASVWYLLAYELNRLRNVSAKLTENRYPPMFTWNFLNGTQANTGVSYFDSWEIIKAGGCPNLVDFPVQNDVTFWMSGYDKYYRAMQNRVINNYSIQVGTPEGVLLLKRYLYDHFDGSKFGGLANFQIASGGMAIGELPENSPDPGAPVIMSFGSIVGHAMTIVGYNDSIKFDLNHDGRYTNDLDINNDRVIDLNDWEKGAFIVYNSWGNWLSRNGMAYVPYHVLARYGYEGGFWNRSVHVVEAAKSHQPVLTLRASLNHTCRGKIRIMAGVSNDPEATRPDHILEFPFFRFQGGTLPLTDPERPGQPFEFGLDITPLSAHIERGRPVKFFLVIDEKDFGGGESGTIRSLGIYNHFGVSDSVMVEGLNIPVESNTKTYAGLVRSVEFNQVVITPEPMVFAKAGEYVSRQLSVTGAAAPYRWELDYDYDHRFEKAGPPALEGTVIYNYSYGSLEFPQNLPFDFSFFGKQYRQIYVSTNGEIFFEPPEKEYPYAIDPSLLFQSRKRIVPFGNPLDFYNPGNGIRYFTSDTVAAITWEGMAPAGEDPVPALVCCKLYRDGRIAFEYGDTEFIRTVSGLTVGVSNGDSRLYRPVDPSGMEAGENRILLNSGRMPLDLRLDATGWLFCRPEEPNALYEIRVRVRDRYNMAGTGSLFISTMDPDQGGLLGQNQPNPFIGSTSVTFLVPESGPVLLEVFDLTGRKVNTLINAQLDARQYRVDWNGEDMHGRDAGAGIYLIRLLVGDRKESKKMVRLNQ